MTFNLADLFERVADSVPEREAIVAPTVRLTYAQLDTRANRLAHAFAARGIGPGDHVGLQLHNGAEYLEAMLAAYKLRAVPVNVNYRYTARELSYLYGNADLVALVYHRGYSEPVARALEQSAPMRAMFVVDDGSTPDEPDDVISAIDAIASSVPYEQALEAASGERDFAERSGDDLYLAYTGGTTGMPKGVMWRHEDIFFAAMGGGDPTTMQGAIARPEEIVGRVMPVGIVMLLLPPLVHVSAQWGAFAMLYGGGTVVLTAPGSLDPQEAWRLVGAEHVNVVTLVGDAMARPMLDAYAADAAPDGPGRYDASALLVFASGGAVLSPSTKTQIAALLPTVITVDGFGSTETGVTGSRARMPGKAVESGSRFSVGEQSVVLDSDGRPVAPGAGVIGRLARKGRVPIGYYNDPAASAAAFVEIDGERFSVTGDAATVEADGTVVVFGRGSESINSGGEKVYPDEVEAVVKDHPAVWDAVIVGVPHVRWGEQVVAVVALRPGCAVTVDEIRAHARSSLADYKLPRALCVVEHVVRGANGKVDYRWARERALAESR